MDLVGDDDSAFQKQAILKDNGKIVEKYINSIHSAFLSIDTYGQPRSSVPTVRNINNYVREKHRQHRCTE